MNVGNEKRALIFDIKRDCSEDGPGIRTTVFFKGCPLSCIWCQNPEGKLHQPQLSYQENLCSPLICNSACTKICPENCLQISPVNKLSIDHERCTMCNKCIEVCPTHALEPVGYWIGLEELLYRVCIDKPFYQSTGGGVTLSGGEVTQQMDFAGEFLTQLKEQAIHTAIETSGFFNYQQFTNKMLAYLDLIYFDLKLYSEEESRKYTGQSNALIMENFKKLINEPNVTVIPRIPLIPGITTKPDNLQAISRLLKELGVNNAVLLPYNPLWQDKSKKLSIKPRYNRTTFMNEDEKDNCVRIFYEKS